MTNAIFPPMVDLGYVQAARLRVEDMRSRGDTTLEPPTVTELEEALGEGVKKCEPLAENWRNRVYRVEFERTGTVLAKQVVMATAEMLEYQFEQLRALSILRIRGLRIPRPLALLRGKRVLLMGFASGKPIPSLVWKDRSKGDLVPACELAGEILGQLQRYWTQGSCAFPTEALRKDFAAAPWRLSSLEQKTVESALAGLRDAEIPVGSVYYDYKAANLIFSNGELSLVDPPDRKREGAHLWDFSCFRSSMRHHLWRFKSRRPFDRRAALIKEGRLAFERSYLSNVGGRLLEPALFALATLLFELQRTAVAMTMQQGKVEIAAQERGTSRSADLGRPWANRATLPLLRMEKRWLVRQLARALA